MFQTAPQGRRLRRLAFATTGALLLGVLAVPTSGSARTSRAEPGAVPGVDEIVSSPNLRQVANLPKQAPFDTLNAPNTDLAMQGRYAFGGNYNGFTIYDIKKPERPTIVTQVLCPGSQNDVSVHGDLLFLSTDSQRTDDSCASVGSTVAAPGQRWEGIRIFDISSPRSPRYIKSVRTACGSHTHTLVPGGKKDKSVYLYVSSYNLSLRSLPNCELPHDKMSIVKVPLNNPTRAAVVATPVLFPDGGFPGGPGRTETTGCHDITAYPDKNLAAGACMGDGVLFDISDRLAPRVLTTVRDANFAFWHSATFNNAATKVIFTDELGGGIGPECLPDTGPTHGADAIFDIVGEGDNRRLEFRSYFKIPRINAENENCVAHNGSLIPVNGRDVMVQAWYQGGISVWDFTDSARPYEIAFWERGPLSATDFITGGSWSAYWYDGYIYSNDIQKGLDVLQLRDPRTDSAVDVRTRRQNAQTQSDYRAG